MSKPWWEDLLELAAAVLTGQELRRAGATPAEAAAAPTVMLGLGSGVDIQAERAAAVHKLRQLQLEAVYNPAWGPQPDGRTFCNRAADFIAQGMGYFGFQNGELADNMIAKMSWDPAWREDTLERAHAHALRGGLAFVCLDAVPHGHVVSLSPEPCQPSGSWGCTVPMAAQVGSAAVGNGVKRLSQVYTLADRPRLRCFLLHPEAT